MSSLQTDQPNKLHWIILSIVFICTFFVNNHVLLSDIMESRNIVTAREMVEDNSWLVPTMNGELRLEKPPLPTWIAGLAEYISPDNIVLQRAMAGLAACLLVVFFYLLACRMSGNNFYGFISALLLCTSYNIILMGRTATWDIYCHAFMMVAIFYLYKGFNTKEYKVLPFIVAGIFLGLSFLGKGPVSFYALLLPFLCSYWFVYRGYLKGKWGGILLMVFLCVIISTWWYLYIYIYHPEMAAFVFKKEATAWVNHNVRPWYYYWQFFLETGVWSLVMLTALIYPYWKKRVRNKNMYVFAFCWVISILFFMSLLPEKKTRYLLPILIPCALLMGELFHYWICSVSRMMKKDRIIFYINGYLIALATLLIPAGMYLSLYRNGQMGLASLIIFSVLIVCVGGFLVVKTARVKAYGFLLGVVMLFMLLEIALMPYLKSIVHNSDFKSIAATRYMDTLQTLPFYHPASEELRIEIVYEAHTKIREINIKNEEEILAALPFVLVSQASAHEILPASLSGQLILKKVDIYDNNRWPKEHKRYNPVFINNVTIIKKK